MAGTAGGSVTRPPALARRVWRLVRRAGPGRRDQPAGQLPVWSAGGPSGSSTSPVVGSGGGMLATAARRSSSSRSIAPRGPDTVKVAVWSNEKVRCSASTWMNTVSSTASCAPRTTLADTRGSESGPTSRWTLAWVDGGPPVDEDRSCIGFRLPADEVLGPRRPAARLDHADDLRVQRLGVDARRCLPARAGDPGHPAADRAQVGRVLGQPERVGVRAVAADQQDRVPADG